MGHVINPISYRLYNVRYWNNNWFQFKKVNYSYIVNLDINLRKFVERFFRLYIRAIDVGIILINLKVLRVFKNTSLYIYMHDSFLDLLMLQLKKLSAFIKIKKHLSRKFSRKYKNKIKRLFPKSKRQYLLAKVLKKRILLKYTRKLFFAFLKNRLIRSFWQNAQFLLLNFLAKIVPSLCNTKVYILNVSKNKVNSNIISEFFYIRLKQFYTIWEILRNVNFLFRYLMYKRKIVKGYKITCSGRFSRKQRTTYSWKVFGSLATSSMKSNLDYSYRTIALKYSTCTIKVWIRLSNKVKRKRRTDYIVQI